LLDQGMDPFEGTVESDEAFVGGSAKWMHRSGKASRRDLLANKTPIHGMAERGRNGRGGRVAVKVVPDIGSARLFHGIRTRVLPSSAVYTDEAITYTGLEGAGYD